MSNILRFTPLFLKIYLVLFESYLESEQYTLQDIKRLLSSLDTFCNINHFTSIQATCVIRTSICILKKHFQQNPEDLCGPYLELKDLLNDIVYRNLYKNLRYELSF